MKQKCMKARC